MLALVRIDTVGKVEGMGFEVNLQEMRDIKQEIYAKAGAVEKLAEEVAQLSFHSMIIAATPITVDADLVVANIPEMIAARDRVVRILELAGSKPDQVSAIRTRFGQEIQKHLILQVYRTAINTNQSECRVVFKTGQIWGL